MGEVDNRIRLKKKVSNQFLIDRRVTLLTLRGSSEASVKMLRTGALFRSTHLCAVTQIVQHFGKYAYLLYLSRVE